MWQRWSWVVVVVVVGGLAVPSAASAGEGVEPKMACADLAGQSVPAREIGLPTSGATIDAAEPGEAPGTTYCKVTGKVLAVDPIDPAIGFQLNLPPRWNRKTVQFGGGGFNGLIIWNGTGPVMQGPEDAPTPLARGFATWADDSGHTGFPLTAEFGINDQALANYGGQSVKRARDTLVAIVRRFYGTAAERSYYIGGSKGGHEALVAAQRYGDDFDGVVSYYPAKQNQALIIAWYRMWAAAFKRPGGALTPAQRHELQRAVMTDCDGLDGLQDEIVSNTEACERAFDPEQLRCGHERAGEACLSDLQMDTIGKAASQMVFDFPMRNGIDRIGPWPVFQGGETGVWFDETGVANGPLQGAAGTSLPEVPVTTPGLATSYGLFTDQTIRFFVKRNPAAVPGNFNYQDWQGRVTQLSHLLDATDPDLDRFVGHGGKLLMVQGTTDMLVPPAATTDYWRSLQQRYGADLSRSGRYYVVPGFGHNGGTFDMRWDSLTALDTWVEDGRPPQDPIITSRGTSRPMCEHPRWPEYRGGDAKVAASFRCVPEDPAPTARTRRVLPLRITPNRATAGRRTVFAVRAPAGTTVRLAGRRLKVGRRGQVRIRLTFRRPGPVRVRASNPSFGERRATITVLRKKGT